METKIQKKRPGYLVITKDGKKGRTYHDVKEINGKMAVYLEIEGKSFQWQEKAILCDPLTLTQKGFIS